MQLTIYWNDRPLSVLKKKENVVCFLMKVSNGGFDQLLAIYAASQD